MKKAVFRDFNEIQPFYSGGQRGIRTLDTLLTYTRVPVVRLRPAQPSVHRIKLSLSRKKGIGASDGT